MRIKYEQRGIFLKNVYYDRPDTSADWTSGPSEDLLGDADDEDLADQLLTSRIWHAI